MPWNTAGNIKGPKGDKGDPGNAADIAALIHAAASKTPADADELPLLDSTGSWGLRKFTWSTLKSLLQSLFFYRGNILGTVSQSSGVPTGAIIQRGSNANGEFVRYADGTQICWASQGFTQQTVAANGELIITPWTYPAAFSGTPLVLGDPADSNSGSFIYRAVGRTTSTTGTSYFVNIRPTSQISPPTAIIFALGRWF